MFISDPHNGIIFLAVRGNRWSKYRWRAVNPATLAEKKVKASQVPRFIRKAAYGLYWRDAQRDSHTQKEVGQHADGKPIRDAALEQAIGRVQTPAGTQPGGTGLPGSDLAIGISSVA